MTRRGRRHLIRLALTMLLSCTVLLGGCDFFRYLAYIFAPNAATTVQAQFDGLANRTVVIVVYAPPAIMCEYPDPPVSLTLPVALRAQLLDNVKGIKVVDPRRVLRYQDENIHWDRMPREKLGDVFQADYVLFINVVEYTTRAPGASNLFRGAMVGEVRLYQCAPSKRQPVWQADDMRVQYNPKDIVNEDVPAIRYETEKMFADTLAKKFYKHKVSPS